MFASSIQLPPLAVQERVVVQLPCSVTMKDPSMVLTLTNTDASTGYEGDGMLQLAAAIALIEKSCLMTFSREHNRFVPSDELDFELRAREQHPKFGRVMLWILFSTGAEYLLKASFLLSGVWTPNIKQKKVIPQASIPWTAEWLTQVDSLPEENVRDFATLGRMIQLLEVLFNHYCADDDQKRLVKYAYKLLAEAIRNRDAHAYVQNVRQSHFHVAGKICPAFNILLSWVNGVDIEQALSRVEPTQAPTP
ncbi:MAG: hypothetical protein CL725_10620 [Chloroflexi bacterium]|nr:hypothetical protein [Chloroflexota bacterium]